MGPTRENLSLLGENNKGADQPEQIGRQISAFVIHFLDQTWCMGAQWLSGRVLDLRPKGRGLEPHRRHCVVSLSKNMNPSLELVQPRKTRPFITERLLMGRKESNQTKKTWCMYKISLF